MYREQIVAVVIPAYNESGLVGDVIDTVPEFIDRAYVVDDGSTDGTWGEIRTHAAAANEAWDHTVETPTGTVLEDRVVPIQHETNAGVGGAIKTGYRRALDEGIDVTTVMAADGQTAPEVMARIVDPVASGDADYAKGNRLLGQDRGDMPTFRQFGNFTLSLLTKIASGYWRVMDPQNGSTAISREALSRIDLDELYDGYGFTNDLLVRLNARELTIADVSRPAVYADEESHIQYRSFVPRLSYLLLRGFLWRLRVKYVNERFHPLAILYPLGAVLLVVGILALLPILVVSIVTAIGLLLLGGLALGLSMGLDFARNEHLQIRRYRQPDT